MKFKKKFFSFSALAVGLVPLVAASCNYNIKTTGDNTRTSNDDKIIKNEAKVPEEIKALANLLKDFNYTGLTKTEFKKLAFKNIPLMSIKFQETVKTIIPDEILKILYNLAGIDGIYKITASKKVNEDEITYKYDNWDKVFTSKTKFVKMMNDEDKKQVDNWKQAVKTIKGTWKTWNGWTSAETEQGVKIAGKYKNIFFGGIESIDGHSRSTIGLQADKILAIKAKTKDVNIGLYRDTCLSKYQRLGDNSVGLIKYILRIEIEKGKYIFADADVLYQEADCPNDNIFGASIYGGNVILSSIANLYKTSLTEQEFKSKAFETDIDWTKATDDETMDKNYGSGGELKLDILYNGKSNIPLKEDLGNGDKVAVHIKKDAGSPIVKYTLTYNKISSTDTKIATISVEVTAFGGNDIF